MPLKICFLGLIVIFLLVKCDVTIDPENSAPQIKVIGFESKIIKYVQGHSYKFKFEVSDKDGDKISITTEYDTKKGIVTGLANENGVYSALYTPSQKGKHHIKIIATDGIIPSSKFIDVVFFLNAPPVAKFTYKLLSRNPKPGLAGDTASVYEFDPHKSNDPDGQIKKIIWEFDGKETVEDTSIALLTYVFPYFGSYKIRMEVHDNDGGIAVDSTLIYNALPKFEEFSYERLGIAHPAVIAFKATVKNNNIGKISYSWDFGDSSAKSTDQSPTKLYYRLGEFTATCTASDSIGVTKKSLQINVSSDKPIASFVFHTPKNKNQESLTWYNGKAFTLDATLSQDCDGSGIKEYKYYFRDLSSGKLTIFQDNLSHPEFTIIETATYYREVGQHTIGLEITNKNGVKSNIKWRDFIILNSPPTASFKAKRSFIDINATIENYSYDIDDSKAVLSYKWFVAEYFSYAMKHKSKYDGQKNPRIKLKSNDPQVPIWIKLIATDRHNASTEYTLKL